MTLQPYRSSPTMDVWEQLETDTAGQVVAVQVQGAVQPGLMLNWTKPPFDDPRVRRAVMLALDRVELIKTVFKGFGRQGTFLPGGTSIDEAESTWPGWRYVDSAGNIVTDPVRVVGAMKHPDDIAEAKKLVIDAGYANNFTGTFMVFNNPSTVQRADLVALQLNTHFGWNITVSVLDLAAAFVERNAGRFDLHSDSPGIELNDPNSVIGQMYLPGGARNPLSWRDDTITALSDLQVRAATPEERFQLILKMESRLRAGIAQWVPEAWLPMQGAVNVTIRNFHTIPPTAIASSMHTMKKMEHLWLDYNATPGGGLGP